MLSFRLLLVPGKGFIDQNDVIADTGDAVPGDIKLLPPAKQPEKAAGSINDNGTYLSLRDPDIHVRHRSQAAAIGDVDDLLAPKILDPALHSPPSFSS